MCRRPAEGDLERLSPAPLTAEANDEGGLLAAVLDLDAP
jgi:hypothetical protein